MKIIEVLSVIRVKALIKEGIATLDMNTLDAYKIAESVESSSAKILRVINKKKNKAANNVPLDDTSNIPPNTPTQNQAEIQPPPQEKSIDDNNNSNLPLFDEDVEFDSQQK